MVDSYMVGGGKKWKTHTEQRAVMPRLRVCWTPAALHFPIHPWCCRAECERLLSIPVCLQSNGIQFTNTRIANSISLTDGSCYRSGTIAFGEWPSFQSTIFSESKCSRTKKYPSHCCIQFLNRLMCIWLWMAGELKWKITGRMGGSNAFHSVVMICEGNT